MSDTPQVLLEHYLKQLRLPTMVRGYAELAEQCAKEANTFEQFRLRLVELEMMAASGAPRSGVFSRPAFP
jgi:hypothetical protein